MNGNLENLFQDVLFGLFEITGKDHSDTSFKELRKVKLIIKRCLPSLHKELIMENGMFNLKSEGKNILLDLFEYLKVSALKADTDADDWHIDIDDVHSLRELGDTLQASQ